jgi:hypothetical protein
MNAKAAAATENKSWLFGLKAGFIISSWSCHLLDDTRQSSSTFPFQYAPHFHLLHQHPIFSMFTILSILYALRISLPSFHPPQILAAPTYTKKSLYRKSSQ